MRLHHSSLLLALLLPGEAWAFKIGTHVWVAQDVINRLEGCEAEEEAPCVQIPFGLVTQEVSVPAAVRDAVLIQKPYYRMGNVGPDAFPDILVGQSVIHPGITHHDHGHETANGFGTSDWLAHLMTRAAALQEPLERQKAIAFVHGFLGHAAADVFAHSYVNTYVGDVFSLDDGNTEAELRHIMLEDYIQKKTPIIADAGGNPLGETAGLLKDGDIAAIPAEFIRQSLIFDPVAQAELKKAPTAAHLVAVVDLYEEIKRALVEIPSGMSNAEYATSIATSYYDAYMRDTEDENTAKEIFEIVKSKFESDAPRGGSIQQAEILAAQVLAYYYFKMKLNDRQAAKTAELLNEFMVFQSQTVGQWHDQRNDIDQKALQMYQRASGMGIRAVTVAGASKPLTAVSDARSRFSESLARQLAASERQHQALVARDNAKHALVAKQSERLCEILPETTCERIEDRLTSIDDWCEKCTIWGGLDGRKCLRKEKYPCKIDVMKPTLFLDPACLHSRATCQDVHATFNRAVSTLQNALAAAETTLRQAEASVASELASSRNEFDSLQQLMISTQRAVESTVQTLKALESNLIGASRALSEGHRAIVRGWVADIENGMREYVRANGQAIIHSIDDDRETFVFTPLTDWMACYLPSIVGLSQHVMDATVCVAKDLKAEYDALHAQLEAEVRKFDPIVAETVLAARDRFREAAIFHAARSANIAFDFLLASDGNLRMTAHVLMSDVEREHLDDQFASDQSADKLPIYVGFGTISERVDSDMQAIGDTKFSVESFAAAYNATIFAALALLDNEGISQLGAPKLLNYTVRTQVIDNLLTKSLRSIDGNHQWMALAPPFVRRESVASDKKWAGSQATPGNVDRRFSLETDERDSGFLLFKTQETRNLIFNRVFKGPLTPALFEARDYGFFDIYPDDYKNYLPSSRDRYPILR